MTDNNPFNVKVELSDGVDSAARFSDANGNLLPERRVLHELITQTVSERKFTTIGLEYETHLARVIKDARELPSYKALEQAGDYNPQKISAVLDEINLKRLPLHVRAEQVMMVTGGPGTGKTSIMKGLEKSKPEIYNNAVQINPDHYKDLLANPEGLGAAHGTYTHSESSMIADDIMGRLDDKMKAGLPAPHVMLDIGAPYPNRVEFAKQFGQMTVMTGTAPPEITIERAYSRGFDRNGNIVDRVVPSTVVLGGTAKASKLLPNVFEHPNLEFTMVNTNVPKGAEMPIVAKWDNETHILTVEYPDTFMDFVERQDLNELAESADELFEGVEHSAESLAQNLQPYTDNGIQIDLLNPDGDVAVSIDKSGVDIKADLITNRGAGFMADMADNFARLGKSGGFVAGVAFGTLSGVFTLAAGGSKAEAAEVTYEAAVPYGETSLDLLDNDMEAAARSATIETASNLGSLGGAVAGAATGAAIGSVVPAVGTTIGGVVGGVAGAIGGGVGAGYITEKVYANFAAIKGGVIEVSQDAMHTLSAAAQAAKSVFGDTWNRVTGHDKPPMHLTAVFNGLPNTVTDDMPPEVQSLIEVKANSDLFARQYEDLKAQGGLEAVAKYMADNPSPPEIAHTYDHQTAQQGIYTPGINL